MIDRERKTKTGNERAIRGLGLSQLQEIYRKNLRSFEEDRGEIKETLRKRNSVDPTIFTDIHTRRTVCDIGYNFKGASRAGLFYDETGIELSYKHFRYQCKSHQVTSSEFVEITWPEFQMPWLNEKEVRTAWKENAKRH